MIKTSRFDNSGVAGYLDQPERPGPHGVLLSHGAGSSANALVLVSISAALAEAGYTVLRIDLPFRQRRRAGPPRPTEAAGDRTGIRDAIHALRRIAPGRVMAGGHSYGGRQSSILAAEYPQLMDGLLLLSYPLHPPAKPAALRTAHFPSLKSRCFFVHGEADTFGTEQEMRGALRSIPCPTELLMLPKVGHDLGGKAFRPDAVLPVLLPWIERI